MPKRSGHNRRSPRHFISPIYHNGPCKQNLPKRKITTGNVNLDNDLKHSFTWEIFASMKPGERLTITPNDGPLNELYPRYWSTMQEYTKSQGGMPQFYILPNKPKHDKETGTYLNGAGVMVSFTLHRIK